MNNHTTHANNRNLTIREQFAMAAMQGILASDHETKIGSNKVAGWAVESADELIKALNRGSACHDETVLMECDYCQHRQTFSGDFVHNGTAQGKCDSCLTQARWKIALAKTL